MTTVTDHYEHHLAPLYLWMTGGAEASLQAGEAEIDALRLPISSESYVVDLGAGFGMHAIPLARRGARVLAVDGSEELLRTLDELRGSLPVRCVKDDLMAFRAHVDAAPVAILCMGDTITHLASLEEVERLIREAAEALRPGGAFIVTFRDYTVPLRAEQRFIPVRSDEQRIFTCFLGYEEERVIVHDILHERTAAGWQMRVSSYPKLRLSPELLTARMESSGLQVRREPGMRGMVRLVAEKGERAN